MNIITRYEPPPIPQRNCDWSAVTDNYDASYEDGGWRSGPIGYGTTEQEAIDDLKEQLELERDTDHEYADFIDLDDPQGNEPGIGAGT